VKTALQTYQLIPKLLPVGALLLGLILGFIWAYQVSPNVYLNAEPVNLSDSWKQEYVKQVAWQFSATNDQANATKQLSYLGNAKEVIDEMLRQPALSSDPNLAPKLQALQQFASDDPTQLAKTSQSFPFRLDITPILCIIGLAILVGGPIIIDAVIGFPTLLNLVQGGRRRSGSGLVVSGLDDQRRQANLAAQAAVQQAPPAPPPTVPGIQGEPVAHAMSTYLLNDDNYDDSFSIETAAGKFLGEMGGGISKTLGTDKPKKVTAVEVWVFDALSTTTTTKVMVSDYAYNDPALRQELSAKGELIPVKPGTTVLMETESLYVQARVINVSYGTGNTPPNSFFDQLTFELSAWPKTVAGAGGAPPPPVQYGAPPQPQASPQPLRPTSTTLGGAPPPPPPGNFPGSTPPPPPPASDPFSADTTRMTPR